MSSGAVIALSDRYDQEYLQQSTSMRCVLSPSAKTLDVLDVVLLESPTSGEAGGDVGFSSFPRSVVGYCNRNRLQVVSPTQETRTAQELGDEELMAEICFGVEWAMEILYQRYYKYVYALAHRIVRDNVVADDIAQEVFLVVWHKAASYRELRGSARTWLLTIVRHKAIDSVRAAMSRDYQYTSLQGGEEQDLPSKEPELWEKAWHQERDAVLYRSLVQLPMKQRQVIELRYFDGFTDGEIADHLHIPLGTVKGRIRLGLQKMKQLLCEQFFE